MMKLLLAGLLILAQGAALGATETTLTTQKLAPKKKLSSSEHREGKKFTLGLGFGLTLSEFSQSLSAEYFIDSDTLVSLRTSYGEEEDTVGVKEEERQFSVELGVKRFVSNSFYLKPTVYYRNYKNTELEDNFWFNDETNGVERYEDIGMGFSIGNQWQFESFTIGCEWFGLSNSVKTFENSTVFDFREYSVNLVNFSVGMSF